jgi:hypothetical protein
MGLRGQIARPITNRIERRLRHWAAQPHQYQMQYFRLLLETAPKTTYGQALGIENGMDYTAYRDCVPLVDYEDLKPYVERIMAGERDVLWPGVPDYLIMSSGTTSGKKYIPATPQGIRAILRGTTDAFCSYIARSRHHDIWDGKTLPLTGSPALTMMGDVPSARVSGLLNHFLPCYARWNRVPSWETNCIADFEPKLSRILDETIEQDVRAITGLPVWLNLLFKRLYERTGKKVIEIWPNLQVMLYGGLQVDPYKAGLLEAIGQDIDFVEVFNASEGFFAFEDNFENLGLLLHMHTGFFYEFMPADAYRAGKVQRLPLQDIELDVDYGLVLNSVSGLWGYNLGDTVRFTSREPYRLVFTGRLAHFTSAFNEHVIQFEVERAIRQAMEQEGGVVSEFTVAPQLHPIAGPPYHEWFVEFAALPDDLEAFRLKLDTVMQTGNHLYRELVTAQAMRPLKLSLLEPDSFLHHLKSIEQVGDQHKVPRLKNDRSIADAMAPYMTHQVG